VILGWYEEARALALRERTVSPEPPHIAVSVGNLGCALLGLGRDEEAVSWPGRRVAVAARRGRAAGGDEEDGEGEPGHVAT